MTTTISFLPPRSGNRLQRALSACKRLAALPVLLAAFALAAAPQASAESITPTRSEAHLLDDGRLSLSSRFHIRLPDSLKTALQDGVPLHFNLSYRLEKPAIASYRDKLSHLVDSNDVVHYRLSFHPLTNRYRLSVGTFSTEYAELDTALRGVGAIANWQILHPGALSGKSSSDIRIAVRLNLSTDQLPKPFQISARSTKWQLDSGWHRLTVSPANH